MTTTTTNTTENRMVTISPNLAVAARKFENGFFSRLPDSDSVEAAARYEKFLTLIQRYPDTPIAPTRDIDEMWHVHMLHPVAYYHDCMANFGEIIDHNGGFGNEAHEVPVLTATFQYTAALWEKEFGEPYTSAGSGSVKCTRNCVSRCKRECKTK